MSFSAIHDAEKIDQNKENLTTAQTVIVSIGCALYSMSVWTSVSVFVMHNYIPGIIMHRLVVFCLFSSLTHTF